MAVYVPLLGFNVIEESIRAIENAENSTLIWLAVLLGMVIGWQVLKLGGQTLAGFFGNDKVQHRFISDLLNEHTETRQSLVNTNNELLQTNRGLSETNKQTVNELKGTTAALAELAREIRGVRNTTPWARSSMKRPRPPTPSSLTILATV